MAKLAIDMAKLTGDEKLQLIDELWESLRPEDFELSDELRAELDRRLARLERDGVRGVPWEEVRSKMNPAKQ